MRKYCICYFIFLLFIISSKTEAMYPDGFDGGPGFNGGFNGDGPNMMGPPQDMMMGPPPMMPMPDNGMAGPQPMPMPDNGMAGPQPMPMPDNGMAPQQEDQEDDDESESSKDEKTEHVKSIVDNILKIRRSNRNGSSANNSQIRNKISRIQRELNELNRSLGGGSIENSSENVGRRGARAVNSGNIGGGYEMNSSDDGIFAGISPRVSHKSRRRAAGKGKVKKLKYNGRSRAQRVHTVKNVNQYSARKYIPRTYSRVTPSYNAKKYRAPAKRTSVPTVTYKVKNWGTGKTSVLNASSHYRPRKYFSDKSSCTNGCG